MPTPNISVVPCTPADAHQIAHGLYTCFPPEWWASKEPPTRAPTDPAARTHAMAQRILPSLSQPGLHWIKAVTSTGDLAGVACWVAPGAPIHSHFRRDAIGAFAWDEKMGWSAEDVDAMWSHVDQANWSDRFKMDDQRRVDVLEGEPHWYLAPLFTMPEFRGCGAARALLEWAIHQADAESPPTAMWLESRPDAMGLYEKVGFKRLGQYWFLRRGPSGEDKVEGEGQKEKEKDA
jgi:GNAT superfamily N-acetyltransferase